MRAMGAEPQAVGLRRGVWQCVRAYVCVLGLEHAVQVPQLGPGRVPGLALQVYQGQGQVLEFQALALEPEAGAWAQG